jgi:hypothetical protein
VDHKKTLLVPDMYENVLGVGMIFHHDVTGTSIFHSHLYMQEENISHTLSKLSKFDNFYILLAGDNFEKGHCD